MARQIQVVLFFLFFSVFIKAQIFQDSFAVFIPDTITGTCLHLLDSTALAYRGNGESEITDITNNTYNLTATGFSAGFNTETTEGGVAIMGGEYLTFASGKYLSVTNDDLNPGTGDFTIQALIKTPGTLSGNKFIVNKRAGGNNGWQLDMNNTDLRMIFLNGGPVTVSVVIGADSLYYVYATCDRDGLMRITAIREDAFVRTNSTSIAALSAQDLNPTEPYRIGEISWIAPFAPWDGGIEWVKFTKSILPSKRLRDDIYLPESWISGFGTAIRGSDGFKFRHCLEGTKVTIKDTDGTFSTAVDVVLTTDSTRYTYNFPLVNSLASDSIKILAGLGEGGETMAHLLSDTTLPAGYGIRVSVDAWEPAGGYVYIDNVTVEGYLVPVSPVTELTNSKFRYHKRWNSFKGW